MPPAPVMYDQKRSLYYYRYLWCQWLTPETMLLVIVYQFDGLVQERRNSIANALELRLSCTNPSNWYVLTTSWSFVILLGLVDLIHVRNLTTP